jgi:acetyl-CoA/propionyl-CoA carboxylase biotin carboxyl carrier protein
VVAADEGHEVSAPGGRWFVKRGGKPAGPGRDHRIDGTLRAPMPGTVLSVNVVPGQPVNKGDVLAVLIAMKIEIALAAPFDGEVAAVGARPGDLVSTRQIVVEVTPADSPGA